MKSSTAFPRFCLIVLLAGCSACAIHRTGSTIPLVQRGSTEFIIYHAPEAPPLVRFAAWELQIHIKKVSGATIAVTTKTPENTPFISLGDNVLYQQANLPDRLLKQDGFVVACMNGNIYIRGIDSSAETLSGHLPFSKGTLFGTYAFIEDVLGVRWFMPGIKGIYVPRKTTVFVPQGVSVNNPDFQWRNIPYLFRHREHREAVDWWLARNRINPNAYKNGLRHEHIWQRVFTPELYQKHPEYFAEQGGERVPPSGASFKICTTNPGAVRVMANAIQEYFNKKPDALCCSMSPTDNYNWCQCSACIALDEPDNHPQGRYTRRILTFYNAVAKIVAETHPDKYCGGILYLSYLYPPLDSSITVEPNVFLVIASLSYGYSMFRPEVKKDWDSLMRSWAGLTENIAYYDLPMHSKTTYGAPLAPNIKSLSHMFPALKKSGIKGLYFYGHPEWGHAALYNYLIAKLMWNADLDIEDHLAAFFSECYGSGGEDLRAIYEHIDADMERYYLSDERRAARYRITPEILKTVYVSNAPMIEHNYFQALSRTPDGPQRQRITMFGDNLITLDHYMKALRVIPRRSVSGFSLTNEEFAVFRAKNRKALHVPQVSSTGVPSASPADVFSARKYVGHIKNREKMGRFRLRDNAHFLLQARRDGPVEIRFTHVNIRRDTLRYSVEALTGETLLSGMAFADDTIVFSGRKGALYHLFIDTASTSYSLEFLNAFHALNTKPASGSVEKQRLHFQRHVTPLYFFIDKNAGAFSVLLNSASRPGTPRGGETAAADLYDPEGKWVAGLSTVAASTDSKIIKKPAEGFWKLKVKEAPTGALDDVYVRIEGQGTSGFVSFDPDNALIIEGRD